LGTQDIVYSANVSNSSGNKLTYKFYIDANNDSTYELISTQSNTSSSGISYAYDISALSAGTYNTKVEVIDSNSVLYDKVSSFTIEAPFLSGTDAVDNDYIYGNSELNVTNKVLQGQPSVIMTAGANNPGASNLIYQFMIDTNNDSIFETIEFVNSYGNSASTTFDVSGLASGTYNTKVKLFDFNNNELGETAGSFTVNEAKSTYWSLLGINAGDVNDKTFDASQDFSIIGQGTPNISLIAGVYNPLGVSISYNFQIDLNRDGDFADSGETLTSVYSSDSNSVREVYNTSGLAVGNYNIRVTASDVAGFSQETNGVLRITDRNDYGVSQWSLTALTADDTDKLFNGSDTNTTDTILRGDTNINIVAGVTNIAGTPLTYTFSIDSNNDGNFEEIGSVTSISGTTGTIAYNTSSLSAGTYNVQVKVSDNFGTTSTLTDVLTVINPTWSASGLDAVDSDGIFGGTDSNATNTVLLGNPSVISATGFSSSQGAVLTFTYSIDSNNDGDYADAGETLLVSRTAGSTIGPLTIDTSTLSSGTYNTRVVITDEFGGSSTQTSSIVVNNPTVQGLDSIDADGVYGGADSNASNTIAAGTSSIVMTVGVTNTSNAVITYSFQIDLNNDGDYADAGEIMGENSSRLSTGNSFTYITSGLTAATYNTRAVLTDINGNIIQTVTNFFTVT
jgi:hypothetical protein